MIISKCSINCCEVAKQRASTEGQGTSTAQSTGSASETEGTKKQEGTTQTQTGSTGQTQGQGKVSANAWQFFVRNSDNSESCLEFGSTSANASLLGLTCVSPAPVRQLFKTEEFASGSLWLDQRTQMCLRLDPNASDPATARVLLSGCKRDGDTLELWSMIDVDQATGEFKIRNVKTGNCLIIGSDRRVVQAACAGASSFRTKP
jgi:hypothetical protein